MATIKERTAANGENRFDVRVRVKGHSVQCKTFRTKTSAQKWARNMESAIDEGRVTATGLDAKHIKFTEVLDRYKAEVLPNKRATTHSHAARGNEKISVGGGINVNLATDTATTESRA